ncbi:MAG TPA: radical SAM protein, partial [Verrucomicrobiae bacterium]
MVQDTNPRGELLRNEGRRYMRLSAARDRDAQLFRTDAGRHLFVVNGSRIFDVGAGLFDRLEQAMQNRGVGTLLDELGFSGPPRIDDQPLSSPPLRALSLAIAQKCNLGCTYCYAQQGDFGGAPKNMSLAVANRAVDLLLADAPAGAKFNLAFLGGEPLLNREALRAVTQRAALLAREAGVTLTFSITTNGTLLTAEDAVFFEEFGFAVTISLDGPREVHDALRPYKGGTGSFDRVMKNLAPFLGAQRRMQVSARVTVTPANLGLRETLDQFLAAGF